MPTLPNPYLVHLKHKLKLYLDKMKKASIYKYEKNYSEV